MAIGTRTATKLVRKNLTATATDTSFSNAGASYRTEVTKIVLTGQSGNTTLRNVTIYIGGTTGANELINVDIDPSGNNSDKSIIIEFAEVLTGTETIYAKQDAGTDINISICGIVQQIA